ncbi:MULTISPECIES: phosphoribosylformylglycinamidine synthase subunit PurS [unclassified Methanoculleus]|uniref:phosphoribosylformylglycinamidine synthase subunit PurS n=1 Tax=unclassified Methanoculleus TaxID=2619537 RepID=UPI0025E20D99|nr:MULTISPECIES: phosphoribosylformylglycinamidine synthase subunit PurS [unclassified Methanoculleus]MCK9317578.1 phosphoribosylformylglycinamidine synthase subunit PurS [Methanoculleus sp.]MDD2254133.1 phosphoribosylformylglycinamidine synthase subunit PurS [Methanoculleus sp.]MDD2786950.1 phosphoribosylformylglycinamidine synthase subunit PurS [Methanoculleus sp.]MDD3215854.1 phosphoribosylformylglycinamidine synthase subunit PurS [Methanoculleus sp.]MDD4314237.1 phosphoribosylformylglycina
MRYIVTITIALKEGMLNPEARVIRHALTNLGFPTEDLSTARLFRVTLDAADAAAAREEGARMCERLLANPVIHHYTIEVT